MPVLARILEANHLSTVLVTTMPYWAERIGVPRALAVEFPFGHTLGQPHNPSQQTRVIQQALEVLQNAQNPGTIIHSNETWPESTQQTQRAWQPAEPSPIVAHLAPRIRELLRRRRQG